MKQPMSDDNILARMTVVESAVERLERTVNTLASSMQRYVEEQVRAPRPIPFKEIMITAAATISVFYGIVQFFEQRMDSNTKILQYRIEQIERKADRLHQLPAIMAIPRQN